MLIYTQQEWYIQPLVAYRFLEEQFVDEFIATGRIRLSSFPAFAKHTDEVRKDTKEGYAIFSANYNTGDGDGYGFFADAYHKGENAFVLSTTLKNDISTFDECKYDSGFVISDVTQFGLEIAKALGHYNAGIQGPCHYNSFRGLKKDMGEFNITDLSSEEQMEKGKEFIEKCKNDTRLLFSKELKHENQLEYRIIWFLDKHTPDHIFLECPRAASYCKKIELTK